MSDPDDQAFEYPLHPGNLKFPLDLFELNVRLERKRQDAKWGEQNHPDGTSLENEITAHAAKVVCQGKAADGIVTWVDILDEEVSEAFAETDPEKLKAELIQIAAVCKQWIECIDRRKK